MGYFSQFDLSLGVVRAPEPEELAAAQIHPSMVDLILLLGMLSDFLFSDAILSLC